MNLEYLKLQCYRPVIGIHEFPSLLILRFLHQFTPYALHATTGQLLAEMSYVSLFNEIQLSHLLLKTEFCLYYLELSFLQSPQVMWRNNRSFL